MGTNPSVAELRVVLAHNASCPESRWECHYLYVGTSPSNNAGVTLASHATPGRAGVGRIPQRQRR